MDKKKFPNTAGPKYKAQYSKILFHDLILFMMLGNLGP